MLFNVEIPSSIVADKDELTDRLYKVITAYVNKKLIYEHEDTKQDCIQDTIMLLLEKINTLTPDELKIINLEKWIYNRMNSFVSSVWLGKLNRYRNRIQLAANFEKNKNQVFLNATEYFVDEDDILSELHYKHANFKEYEDYFIDYLVLANIIQEYQLGIDVEVALLLESDKLLKDLGFTGVEIISDKQHRLTDTLSTVVKSIVDEYISKTKGGENL